MEDDGCLLQLICDVLSVLVGKDLLDYSLWDELKVFYFEAIHAGRCVRELLLYDATGGRYVARLTGETDGFCLRLVTFKLLLNFLYRSTGFYPVELATAR